MIRRREMVAALCAVGLVACSALRDDPGAASAPTSSLLAQASVGPLPPALSTIAFPLGGATTSPTPTPSSSSTSTVPVDPGAQIGTLVDGNRVLMIGDSILASASKRYGNEVCTLMTPLGWQVEIEAEVSRFVGFGLDVADQVLDDTWDAGLIFLGTNYNRDAKRYFASMNRLINEFGDRPVAIVTVGERNDDMVEVNSILRALDGTYSNVSIVDWAAATAADPSLLVDDEIHPSGDGRLSLAMLIAARFGSAPAGSGRARCLDQVFTDDTAGIPGFPDTSSTTTSVAVAEATTSTTSVPRSSTTTSVPRTTVPVTTGPGTTAPGTTAPVTTAPATVPTVPPTTTP